VSQQTLEARVVVAPPSKAETAERTGRIKVRLTLGPALIDLEATLEEIVVVVTRLTQEFTREKIIGPSEVNGGGGEAEKGSGATA
jgi:hypothetical protein